MHRIRWAACLLAALAASGRLPGQEKAAVDWPQWRGPNRDGILGGVRVPGKWPVSLKQQWQVRVGEGYSSPVVVGQRVYVFARQKDHEVVRCLDLASGKEQWKSKPYPAPFKAGPGAPGDVKTRSTPTVARGRVFTLGVAGALCCWDARTGELLWRKDTKAPIYGASVSALVDRGLCITQVGKGGLTAFDATNGKVKWSYEDVVGGPAYGSPILVELAGQRQVVTVTQNHLLGVAAATGKLLWQVHVPRWDIQQCITPVLYRDLIIFAESGGPLRALRLEKGGRGITAKEVWKAKSHTRSGYHMSSPVLAGDWLFGFAGEKSGHLYCLEAKTGKTLWQSRGRLGSNASLLTAGSVWLALSSGGRLLVVKPNGTAYEVLARYRVAEGGTDAYPVFLGDRILIKDGTTLRSLRVEEKGEE
jgi:outer membrane protein assembly factor BamB